MKIHIMVWDENGLSTGDIPLPDKTVGVTLIHEDRQITYDPESLQVLLTKVNPDGSERLVEDFDDDLIPVEV